MQLSAGQEGSSDNIVSIASNECLTGQAAAVRLRFQYGKAMTNKKPDGV